MEIYMIRHTAVDVPPGYTYGQTDVGLKDTFEEEAARVRETIGSLQFDKVYTSPLSRCVKLCNYCGFTGPIKEDRIKELHFGEWEMTSFQDLSVDPRSKDWFADWIHYRTPGGESFMDQYERVASFLDELRRSGMQRVAVFAHGGVLTCARVYAGIYELSDAFANIPSYGEVIRLTLDSLPGQ